MNKSDSKNKKKVNNLMFNIIQKIKSEIIYDDFKNKFVKLIYYYTSFFYFPSLFKKINLLLFNIMNKSDSKNKKKVNNLMYNIIQKVKSEIINDDFKNEFVQPIYEIVYTTVYPHYLTFIILLFTIIILLIILILLIKFK